MLAVVLGVVVLAAVVRSFWRMGEHGGTTPGTAAAAAAAASATFWSSTDDVAVVLDVGG